MEQKKTPEQAVKGPLHLGPALSVYMSPFTWSSAVIRSDGKKQKVARVDQEAVGRAEYWNTRR